MKNLSFLFCLLLSSSIIFVGCKDKETPPEPTPNYPTTDEGVNINGVIWATRNVAAPGTFALKPEDFGMFYQWNRRVGWSSTEPLKGSNNAKTWDTSVPGGTVWEQANDPCPKGWRVPTFDELQSLIAHFTWKDKNGVTGLLLGEAPNQIFLPAAGWRYQEDGKLSSSMNLGYYWSNSKSGDGWAWGFEFSGQDGGYYRMTTAFQASGRSIRCVKSTE